jgi:hypothetical protein
MYALLVGWVGRTDFVRATTWSAETSRAGAGAGAVAWVPPAAAKTARALSVLAAAWTPSSPPPPAGGTSRARGGAAAAA